MFSVADATGRVIRTGIVPFEEWIARQALAGETAVSGTLDPATQYVADGAAANRPTNPATISGHALASLPVPCTIHIDSDAYPCSEVTAELSFPYAGTFAVRVEAWPYLDAAFEVTA
ncbi:hypothetical protein [Cupriavidus numazuensis]|nr:hypothetical protein [Cupriavidus numazuensis]